jgi:hypothetical protein
MTTMRVSASGGGRVHAKHHPRIRERDDAASDVDEAGRERRGVRHVGDRHQVEYLAHAAGGDGEHFVLQAQRQRRH